MALIKTPVEIKKLRDYNGQHGIIYYYFIKFKDGNDTIEGEFSTNKDPQTKFEVGKAEYITQITKHRKDNNAPYLFFDIDKIAKDEAQKQSGNQQYQSYYDRPEVQIRITKSWSLEQAVKTLSFKSIDQNQVGKDHPLLLAKKYYDWAYSGNPNNQLLLTKRQALEHANSSELINCLELKSSEAIIKQAEVYLVYLSDQPAKSDQVI